MNPDYLWALIPAVCVVLLNLDTLVSDAARACAWVLARVLRVGATWT